MEKDGREREREMVLLCIHLLLCYDWHIRQASGGLPGLWWDVGGARGLGATPTLLCIKFTYNITTTIVNTLKFQLTPAHIYYCSIWEKCPLLGKYIPIHHFSKGQCL